MQTICEKFLIWFFFLVDSLQLFFFDSILFVRWMLLFVSCIRNIFRQYFHPQFAFIGVFCIFFATKNIIMSAPFVESHDV